MNAPTRKPAYLPGIAMLRCISVMLVLLCHIANGAFEPPPEMIDLESAMKPLGWVGVSIFFCMSGYLMEHHYGVRVRAGAMSWREYAAKRCNRLLPTYFAVAIPAIAAFIWTKRGDLQVAFGGSAAYAALLQSWVADRVIYLGGNVPAWSLSVEAFLYATSFRLLRVSSRVLVAAGLLAVGMVLRQALPLLALDAGLQQTFEWGFYVFPPLRLIEFCAGILLCRAQHRWPARALHDRGALLLGLASILLAACIANAQSAPLILRWQLLVAGPACLAVGALARIRSALARQLSTWFGAAAHRTYSVFLTHYLCISLVHRLLEHFHSSGQPLGVAAELCRVSLLIVSSIVVGELTYRYVERPLSARWVQSNIGKASAA